MGRSAIPKQYEVKLLLSLADPLPTKHCWKGLVAVSSSIYLVAMECTSIITHYNYWCS